MIAVATIHTIAPGSPRISLPPTAAPTIFLATSEGLVVVDTIAVERAINGGRQGWTLTSGEAHYAASVMFEHGIAYSVVAARVGRSTDTLRRWFPEHVVPSTSAHARGGARKEIEHGTQRGYRAHLRRPETPCKRCKAASAAADRRRRLTGTAKDVQGVAA